MVFRSGPSRRRKSAPRVLLVTCSTYFVVWNLVGWSWLDDSSATQHTAKEQQEPPPPHQGGGRRRTHQLDDGGDDDSFSACLLIMDDNHFLTEWLAYHSHVLPLTNLIVAVDPHSRTSPAAILHRWEGQGGTNIVQWNDDDYLYNATELAQAQDWVSRKFRVDNISPDLVRHRARQRLFYYKCMQTLQQQGKGWTLLADTDEFLRVNYQTAAAQNLTVTPITEPGSLLKTIQQQLDDSRANNTVLRNLLSSPCVQIPRIRFGAVESKPSVLRKALPRPRSVFNASNFATLRWRRHAAASNYAANRISKVMIDLRRVDAADLQPVDSIHRPVRSLCTQRRLHIRANEQLLVLHHYLGTEEQYMSRMNDARTGKEHSLQQYRKAAKLNQGTDDDIRPWLQGFVSNVGVTEAKRLLENVGVVERNIKMRG